MAKHPDPDKLRTAFDETLAEIWKAWDSVADEEERKHFRDPFASVYWMDLLTEGGGYDDEARDILHRDIGWVQGVSDALGWPLYRPTGKEWRPRAPWKRGR